MPWQNREWMNAVGRQTCLSRLCHSEKSSNSPRIIEVTSTLDAQSEKIVQDALVHILEVQRHLTHTKSSSTCTQYVFPTKEYWKKKSQNILIWIHKLAGPWIHKLVSSQHFCTSRWSWYKAQQRLTHEGNWLHSSIGPGGWNFVFGHVKKKSEIV